MRRSHRQPVVEKFERNPLADFKPGVFIPTFRLYGLEKGSDEVAETYYNDTDYLEKKAEKSLGFEVRLSECSIKAVSIKHQGERRLQQEIESLNRRKHATMKETDNQKQRLRHENTMKVKRVTKPLKDLKIPAWRYTDNLCKCVVGDGSYCPIHWKSVHGRPPGTNMPLSPTSQNNLKSHLPVKQRSFIVETVSDSDDEDYSYRGDFSRRSVSAISHSHMGGNELPGGGSRNKTGNGNHRQPATGRNSKMNQSNRATYSRSSTTFRK